MEEQNENNEQYEDLQAFSQAEANYQEKFGRSFLLDAMTIINSQELQQATQQNPELLQFLQGNEMDAFVPVVKEIMQTFINQMPEPVPEQQEEGLPEEEAGRPEEGLNEQQPMQ